MKPTDDELKRLVDKGEFAPNNLQDMASELLSLREATRWRKYPELPIPDTGEEYEIVRHGGDVLCARFVTALDATATRYSIWVVGNRVVIDGVKYWRPFHPPLEEKDVK